MAGERTVPMTEIAERLRDYFYICFVALACIWLLFGAFIGVPCAINRWTAMARGSQNRFTPLVERMIAETAVKVPPGFERSGAFHVDRLPCGISLYLLPDRGGNVFAMRAYVVDDDFARIVEAAHDAKLAIREAAGEPLYTRSGIIVWRVSDLEITLYVGHRVIEIGTMDLHRDWR